MIQTKIAVAVSQAFIQLRPYQADVERDIYQQWGLLHQNVLAVLPTGAGKTVLFAKIIRDHKGASCAVAHRQELVSQISLALAKNCVPHRIIGPPKLIRTIVNMHMVEIGRSWYDPSQPCAVAGVDTLKNRGDQLESWLPTVGLIVMDEAHHVLAKNKWGKACQMFPNAKGLFVTATPCRADGQGLGRHHDGLVDSMVVGPTMRELIDGIDGIKYLTDYRIFAPPSDLDTSHIDISKTTGDYNLNQMRDAVTHSSIVSGDSTKAKVVGDIVKHYLRIAPGKLGITFVPTVDDATKVAAQFNASGVPAAVVSANTPVDERAAILRKFKRRELLQLVNVDLFGEGFDLPAIEVVSMGRPTASYSLYVQQFGRALRLLDGKLFAIIIDHVGNVMRHGLPDMKREWTLDRRDKRSKSDDDVVPVRTCLNVDCLSVYERYKSECPYCGTRIPAPTSRDGPEFVDGDLHELDAETLARMRNEVAEIERPLQEQMTEYGQNLLRKKVRQEYAVSLTKKFGAKIEKQQQAVEALREIMAWWAGHYRAKGHSNSEIYRIFYITFSVDWLSAQALPTDNALKLAERVAIKTGKIE